MVRLTRRRARCRQSTSSTADITPSHITTRLSTTIAHTGCQRRTDTGLPMRVKYATVNNKADKASHCSTCSRAFGAMSTSNGRVNAIAKAVTTPSPAAIRMGPAHSAVEPRAVPLDSTPMSNATSHPLPTTYHVRISTPTMRVAGDSAEPRSIPPALSSCSSLRWWWWLKSTARGCHEAARSSVTSSRSGGSTNGSTTQSDAVEQKEAVGGEELTWDAWRLPRRLRDATLCSALKDAATASVQPAADVGSRGPSRPIATTIVEGE